MHCQASWDTSLDYTQGTFWRPKNPTILVLYNYLGRKKYFSNVPSDLQFVIKCPQADIWGYQNVCRSVWKKTEIIRKNNGIIQIVCKFDILWPILKSEATFSALCSILLWHQVLFSSSKMVKFYLITPIYKEVFFWSKMSAIFTKNVRKHCLHACSFLRVWSGVSMAGRGEPPPLLAHIRPFSKLYF